MLISVQPKSWPEPAMRAAYRLRELPVTVRDRLGELFPDAEFAPGSMCGALPGSLKGQSRCGALG
jgi:hypothetical protein